jgi:hypothetical protein
MCYLTNCIMFCTQESTKDNSEMSERILYPVIATINNSLPVCINGK